MMRLLMLFMLGTLISAVITLVLFVSTILVAREFDLFLQMGGYFSSDLQGGFLVAKTKPPQFVLLNSITPANTALFVKVSSDSMIRLDGEGKAEIFPPNSPWSMTIEAAAVEVGWPYRCIELGTRASDGPWVITLNGPNAGVTMKRDGNGALYWIHTLGRE